MRSLAILSAAVLGLTAAALPAPAEAQSLGQWGIWGERPDRSKSQKRRPPERFERLPDRRVPRGFDPWWEDDPWYERPPAPSGPRVLSGGGRPAIAPREPEVVVFNAGEAAGTIIIDTSKRRLYYTLGGGEAYAYPISVGRDGFTWSGTETISRVAEWPDWHPPKEMRQRDPKLPEKMTGGVRNPLGAVALYLGTTLYRIHGTNDKKTIGQAASSGCFRMLNEHAVHLASIAGVGTVVKVLPHLPPEPSVVSEPLDDPFDEPPMADEFTERPDLPQIRDPGVERLDIVYRR